MKLIVNGQEQVHPVETTLTALLNGLKVPEATVVAELNGEIIPRENFAGQVLKDADVLELVTLVGGG